jgi:hypothetical protein
MEDGTAYSPIRPVERKLRRRATDIWNAVNRWSHLSGRATQLAWAARPVRRRWLHLFIARQGEGDQGEGGATAER